MGRQHNNEKKKDKPNITHKTKDQVTRMPLKTEDELRCSGRVSCKCRFIVYKTFISFVRHCK